MTRDEILSMPAGMKMNVLVAEKIMEYKWYCYESNMDFMLLSPTYDTSYRWVLTSRPDKCLSGMLDYVPNFSENIADAWEAVEKWEGSVKVLKNFTSTKIERITGSIKVLQEKSVRYYYNVTVGDLDFNKVHARADTAPHAICIGLLLAVEQKNKDHQKMKEIK